MQVTQDYQKALQQINNNRIPDDLLADGIKKFVDFTADLSTVFRTRLSIRFAQQYYTITTRLCQTRLYFLASVALALGKRGKGKHLLPLPRPRWLQGSEGSRTRMTSLLVLSKIFLYAQLRWSKTAIMNHHQSSMINRQKWFVSSTIITWLWQFTSTIHEQLVSLFHHTHVNQPNNLNHDGGITTDESRFEKKVYTLHWNRH